MADRNTLVRFAHTLGVRKKITHTALRTIAARPGLPKFVPLALKPVIVMFTEAMYTHGIKHTAASANTATIPICWEYFMRANIQGK